MSKDDTDTSAPPSPSHDGEVRHGEVLPPSDNAVVPAQPALPIAPELIAPTRRRSRWKALGLLAIVLFGACGAGAWWWHSRQGGVPLGIVSGNGRIEADEIDIDTKFAGRIAEMFADEGDMVKAAAGRRPHGHPGHRGLAREIRGAGPGGAAEPR